MESQGTTHRARAFTLIETLVVIVVIGILAALLVVAVQSARESARRVQCLNHLKQIGLALQNYHAAVGTFPPAYATGLNEDLQETGKNWGWAAMILGYLDQDSVYNSINFSYSLERPASQTSVHIRIGSFVCPSSDDPRPVVVKAWYTNEILTSALASSNYVASAGNRALGRSFFASDNSVFTRNSNEDGAMYRNSNVSAPMVRDGLSNTFLCGERSRGLSDVTWAGTLSIGYGQVCTNSGTLTRECVSANVLVLGHTGPENGGGFPIWVDAPNYRSSGADAFWSTHPGGCNFLMCDGSVRFVKDSINPKTYSYLATRSHGEAVSSDQY